MERISILKKLNTREVKTVCTAGRDSGLIIIKGYANRNS
jgi:hypothetical protein